MRPNLSQFVLICILIAIPIVQWAVHRKVRHTEPAKLAQTPLAEFELPKLQRQKSPAEWADSAQKTADEITHLASVGRLSEAAELTAYALALPRHPTFNNPHGVGHATLALEQMIDAFAAYELWDEAVQFCMQPNAIGIGNAMVESKRLRLMAVAFANKRQLKFRSQIILSKLGDVRKDLDWRQGLDEHHNDICDPADLIEVDYPGNEAARKHIAESIQIVTALQSQRKETNAAAATIAASDASPLVKARALALAGQTEQVRPLLSEFATSTQFAIASHLVRAELNTADFDRAALRSLASRVPVESPVYDRVQDCLGNDIQLTTAVIDSVEPSPFLKRLAIEFPLSRVAPDFELTGADGEPRRLSDRRGKPTLVVFYLGRGCLHCSRQLKNLAPAMDDFQNAGIDVLGISTDNLETLTDSFRSYRGRIPFPLVSDGDLATFEAYRLNVAETEEPLHGTFLINADGNVIWSDTGEEPFMDMEFLLKEGRRLLKQVSATRHR